MFLSWGHSRCHFSYQLSNLFLSQWWTRSNFRCPTAVTSLRYGSLPIYLSLWYAPGWYHTKKHMSRNIKCKFKKQSTLVSENINYAQASPVSAPAAILSPAAIKCLNAITSHPSPTSSLWPITKTKKCCEAMRIIQYKWLNSYWWIYL